MQIYRTHTVSSLHFVLCSLLVFVTAHASLHADQVTAVPSAGGLLFELQPNNSMFPSPLRAQGHHYQNKHYPAATHYQDKTTLVYVPQTINLQQEFEVIVYFHGWYNNASNSLTSFNLAKQLIASKRNAILIIPQGPKNAPDSSGGRMEEAGHFKRFINDVLQQLPDVSRPLNELDIILAGHSGAYRAMAFILTHGGMTNQIREVYLFDGLYAQIEKFSDWMSNSQGRFINIYTPDGGTRSESEELIQRMTEWKLPFHVIEGDDFTDAELRSARIIFIASELGHNDVISKQLQLQRFLSTGLAQLEN